MVSGGGEPLALRGAPFAREGTDADDAALVRAAKDGDARAFALLFERYMPQVFRFSFARLGDHDEAEDVTSTTFAKLAAAIRRYDERGRPFRAFLFRIARNALIDHVRSRRERVPLDDLAGLPATGSGAEPDAAALSDRVELVAALARLPDVHREVLSLRFMEGYPAADVAVIVGKSESAVRTIQHRALRQLRATLGEDQQ